MLNVQQADATKVFAESIQSFIDSENVVLRMSGYQEEDYINRTFYILGNDNNRHFLGKISFDDNSSNNYKYFIDYEVVDDLKDKGWL